MPIRIWHSLNNDDYKEICVAWFRKDKSFKISEATRNVLNATPFYKDPTCDPPSDTALTNADQRESSDGTPPAPKEPT